MAQEDLNSPTGACVSVCNHRARQAWAVYRQELDNHADAVDAWVRDGERGDPPAEPTQPTATFYPGDPLFCGRCLAGARTALLDLDVLAAQLASHADGLRDQGPSEARVAGSKGRPSVSPVGDLLDRMLGDLFDAEDEWRQMCDYAARDSRRHRGSHPRSRTINWLEQHLTGLLAHEDMVDFARTVFNWETVLRDLAKDDKASGKSNVRCPRPACGERRFSWDVEARNYRCGACGNILYEKEHDHRELEERELAEAVEQATPRPPVVRRPLPQMAEQMTSGRA